VALKGKTQPVPVFKVLGGTSAGGFDRVHAAPTAAAW